MKNFIRFIVLSIALLSSSARGTPIDASATVSGSANHWTYDFAFTNNMDSDWKLYFIGVALPHPGTPVTTGGLVNWGHGTWVTWPVGGSYVVYNTNWYDESYSGIAAGETTHLRVSDSGNEPLWEVNWAVYAISSSSPYSSDWDAIYPYSHLGSDSNPLFEGQAIVTAVAAVPEPHTYLMLLAGLGLAGVVARRRRIRR